MYSNIKMSSLNDKSSLKKKLSLGSYCMWMLCCVDISLAYYDVDIGLTFHLLTILKIPKLIAMIFLIIMIILIYLTDNANPFIFYIIYVTICRMTLVFGYSHYNSSNDISHLYNPLFNELHIITNGTRCISVANYEFISTRLFFDIFSYIQPLKIIGPICPSQ